MFNEELDVPVYLSSRFRTCNGRAYWKLVDGKKIPRRISISKDLSYEEQVYVLTHELIHIYLFKTMNYAGHGKPFTDIMDKYYK